MTNYDESIDAYYWKLPSFKQRWMAQRLQYSSKYGLISVGDLLKNNNLAILTFDDDKIESADNHWKWEILILNGNFKDVQYHQQW